MTALMHASQKGHAQIVKKLLESGASKDLKDFKGRTVSCFSINMCCPNHFYYCMQGFIIVPCLSCCIYICLLLQALMIATVSGHLHVVHKLLEAGVDMSLKNNAGSTALDLATMQGQTHVCFYKSNAIEVLKLYRF